MLDLLYILLVLLFFAGCYLMLLGLDQLRGQQK